MIAWILEYSNLEPSFLIGGVPLNFNVSARQSTGQVFVIEADEYDKSFLHLHADIAVITSIDEDHLDFYKDL